MNSITKVYPGFKKICEDIEQNLLTPIRCRKSLDSSWVDYVRNPGQSTLRLGLGGEVKPGLLLSDESNGEATDAANFANECGPYGW